jgi:formylglycine-generating enzyme required for sulfatase activity
VNGRVKNVANAIAFFMLIALFAMEIPISGRMSVVYADVKGGPEIDNESTELHDAVADDDAEAVRKLSGNKALINRKNCAGETPLYVAIDKGRYSVAELLIASGSDVNAADIEGITPLHLLSRDLSERSAELAAILIKRGADTKARDCHGKTSMHGAASSGNIRILTLLLGKGADVTQADDSGVTPLIASVMGLDSEFTPAVVDALVRAGADVNAVSDHGACLHCIASLGEDVVDYAAALESVFNSLVRRGADVNLKDRDGRTPLHAAVENNRWKLAALLVEKGAMADIRNGDGESALDLAGAKGDSDMLALLRAGASAKVIETGGIEFVPIPSGDFLMGSHGAKSGEDETPPHRVKVGEFYMSRHEITQGQYKKYMGKNPARTSEEHNALIMEDTGRFPVESVTWGEALEFCRTFGKINGIKARLPYEAEWEYACRAGSESEYFWGDEYEKGYAVDYIHTAFGRKSPAGVGMMKPNRWGLFDMCGNVKEWCMDWYDGRYYSVSSLENPRGPVSGRERVVRGGGFESFGRHLGSARRGHEYPDRKSSGIGFRIVVEK